MAKLWVMSLESIPSGICQRQTLWSIVKIFWHNPWPICAFGHIPAWKQRLLVHLQTGSSTNWGFFQRKNFLLAPQSTSFFYVHLLKDSVLNLPTRACCIWKEKQKYLSSSCNFLKPIQFLAQNHMLVCMLVQPIHCHRHNQKVRHHTTWGIKT